MNSMEGFNFIMSLVIMPMFFTSGALFPISAAPGWLQVLSYFNPLTYGVDLLRWATTPGTVTILPAYTEAILLVCFAAAMIVACSYTFSIKK
jgi:ABC-2 type transport system permease protein